MKLTTPTFSHKYTLSGMSPQESVVVNVSVLFILRRIILWPYLSGYSVLMTSAYTKTGAPET